MLIIDSGLGGLSVVRAIRAKQPAQRLTYLADTAWFPYGGRTPEALTQRATLLLAMLAKTIPPQPIIVACNTLSTLALATLRTALPYAFVGTVPAIKVAAQQSVTKRFTLLATPNTVHSAYTHDLIAQFAQGCRVDLVESPTLAPLAEGILLGAPADSTSLQAAIAGAFYDDERGRTDSIVLGCTHYPLITEHLKACAPWPVQWIDSGDAIARRALSLAPENVSATFSYAYVTKQSDIAGYREVFHREGFDEVRALIID